MAALWRRAAAFLFDSAVLAGALWLLWKLMIIALWVLFGQLLRAHTRYGGHSDYELFDADKAFVAGLTVWGWMVVALAAGAFFAYFGLLESSRWRATIGKQLLGVVVTDRRGGRISRVRAFWRRAASLVTLAILPLSIPASLLSQRRRTLHDLAAGTEVRPGLID